MTNRAMTCPSRAPCIRENVTRERLVALSMSSTPMKTMIALRLVSTVAVPIEKRITDR